MRTSRRISVLIAAIVLVPTGAYRLPAEETPASAEPTPRELGEQVDVLQIVADLELDENQLKAYASKTRTLKQKHEEALKREETILSEIKEHLRQMRDKLAVGEQVDSSTKSITDAKLKQLEEIRAQFQQEFLSAVNTAAQLISSKQVRKITRSPEARRRAAEIVQTVRSTPEQNWQQTLADLTAQLLEVQKMDKSEEWRKAEVVKLADLTGEDKEKARKELEKQEEADIAQMQAEIAQKLTNIRGADRRLLSIAIDNLCSDIRPKSEIRFQLLDMIARILSNPSAEAALDLRLANLRTTSEEPAAQ